MSQATYSPQLHQDLNKSSILVTGNISNLNSVQSEKVTQHQPDAPELTSDDLFITNEIETINSENNVSSYSNKSTLTNSLKASRKNIKLLNTAKLFETDDNVTATEVNSKLSTKKENRINSVLKPTTNVSRDNNSQDLSSLSDINEIILPETIQYITQLNNLESGRFLEFFSDTIGKKPNVYTTLKITKKSLHFSETATNPKVLSGAESDKKETNVQNNIDTNAANIKKNNLDNNQSNYVPSSLLNATTIIEKEGINYLAVGLQINKRNLSQNLLVRGQDNGSSVLNFSDWLLPYNNIIEALQLNQKTLPNGDVEITKSGFVTRIRLNKLRKDAKLGLAISVSELQTLLGVKAEFDINDYAIRLQTPWSTTPVIPDFVDAATVPPQLDGLAEVSAPDFSLTALEQRFTAGGRQGFSTDYQGELKLLGTALGGSWFIDGKQQQLGNLKSWRIEQAQFLRQTQPADYIFGSQTPFWLGQSSGNYWGFTTIQRHGFTPPDTLAGASPNPRQRMQATFIGKTITGKAEPGTLVQLTQAFDDRPIAEVLVDSSGIYRFADVSVDSRFLGNNYRLLLYPQGKLTSVPEVRNVTFSATAGQLPTGGSTLIASAGFRRQFSGTNSSLIGDFSDFSGGIAQRWGLSEDLTVGIGGVYDESFRGLGEIFFQPKGIPLKVAVSGLSGNKRNQWDFNADILFEFSPKAYTRFTSDSYGSRLDFNWQVSPTFSLLAGYDNRDGTFGGLQIIHSGKNSFTFARATLDSNNHFRWNVLQNFGNFELNSVGNEVNTWSQLAYNLSGKNSFAPRNSLFVGYETGNFLSNNSLMSFGWRYRSQPRPLSRDYLWDAQLGYGIGSQGSGIIASLGTNIISGLRLQGRYQGVSLNSDQASFALELVSSLDLQRGIRPNATHRSEYYRTQGGVLIQPFLDHNQNGKRDSDEPIYTENPELLLVLNNRSLKSFSPEIRKDGIFMHLNPGKYRLDLEPAGAPNDSQAMVDALAVDVAAGGYTVVEVPLVNTYTRTGVVTNTKGKALAGVRVEAIHTNSGIRKMSITNSAGVYYLQGLLKGNYTIEIDGNASNPKTFYLEESPQTFQEINLVQVGSQNQAIK